MSGFWADEDFIQAGSRGDEAENQRLPGRRGRTKVEDRGGGRRRRMEAEDGGG